MLHISIAFSSQKFTAFGMAVRKFISFQVNDVRPSWKKNIHQMCSQKQLQGVVDRIWKAFPWRVWRLVYPGGFSQAVQQAGSVRWFLRLFSFIIWKETFVMNTQQQNCLPSWVLRNLQKLQNLMKRKKLYPSCFFFHYLLLFLYLDFSEEKEMLICLSGLRSLWGLWRTGVSQRSSTCHYVATAPTSWFAVIIKTWLVIPRLPCSVSEPHIAMWNLLFFAGIFYSWESALTWERGQLLLSNGDFITMPSITKLSEFCFCHLLPFVHCELLPCFSNSLVLRMITERK